MKNIRVFYLNIFSFLEMKFSIYLNRRVFLMVCLHVLLLSFVGHDLCLCLFLNIFFTIFIVWIDRNVKNYMHSC